MLLPYKTGLPDSIDVKELYATHASDHTRRKANICTLFDNIYVHTMPLPLGNPSRWRNRPKCFIKVRPETLRSKSISTKK